MTMKKCTFISFLLSLTIACGSTSCARQTTTQTHTIKDNGITITWIQDNATPKTMPASLFSQEAQAIIDSLGMKESGIPSTISSFLVQVGGKNILFDTGLGLPDSRLLKALQSLQISPDNIQYIFLTHFHGDHIGGLLTNKGETVFKQAQIYAARAEYEGWMKMPQNQRTQIEKTVSAYGNRLHLFSYSDTLPENICALEAKRHTPGHTVYRIGRFFIAGDLIHGATLQILHPEFCASYDQQAEQAVSTRRYYLEYVRRNHLIMAGMHLPAPGFWEP